MIKVLAAVVLLWNTLPAGAFYMLDFRLQSLHSRQEVDLNRFKGTILFLTFIDSDCSWCEKQLDAFHAVVKGGHAEAIQVVAVVMGDDTEALKARTTEVGFPVLKASEYLLKSIGSVTMTPYILIADRKGNFATKIVGYSNKDHIESMIDELEGKK